MLRIMVQGRTPWCRGHLQHNFTTYGGPDTRTSRESPHHLVCADNESYQASCETIFKEFNVRESINVLHGVVTDARARKQRGETGGKDIWREDLDPHTAVRARTVPVLEAEVEKLKETLQGASLLVIHHWFPSTHVPNSSRRKT